MGLRLRAYEPRDFEQLYALDHLCFPPGIAYSKWMLRHFLKMPAANCIVATDGEEIPGFVITEEAAPLGHILTLDIAESYRRRGLGTKLLQRGEAELSERGVTEMVLETAVENAGGVAFWQRHGYHETGVLKRYYLRRLDAYEMRKKLAPSAKK